MDGESWREAQRRSREGQEHFFDTKCATMLRTDPRLPHEVHVKHFVDEHAQQMLTAKQQHEQSEQEILGRRTDYRTQRLNMMKESQQNKREEVSDGSSKTHHQAKRTSNLKASPHAAEPRK